MDPVSVVVTALVTGVAAGVSGVASEAVTKAYESLRKLVLERLRDRGTGDGARLVEAGADLGAGTAALSTELSRAGVDESVVNAAVQVFAELAALAGKARFVVNAPDAKGLMVGDGNTQHNTFND